MSYPDFKILFIHGYTASSKADFYPALSVLLDKAHIDYAIPDLPGEKYPHAHIWLEKLHESIKNSTKPLIIVGHSLGTRTALLYIEKYLPKVKHLFLIAAFANRLENAKRRDEVYSDFFENMVDVTKIKSVVEHSYVLHSNDDHSIPIEQGREIAHELDAEIIVSTDRDHYCESSNAPYIFSLLKEKIGF